MIKEVQNALDAHEPTNYWLRAALVLLPPGALAVILAVLAPEKPTTETALHWLNGLPIIATAFGAALVAVALFVRPWENSEQIVLSLYASRGERLARPASGNKASQVIFDTELNHVVSKITEAKRRLRKLRDWTGGLELSGAFMLALGGIAGVAVWSAVG